MTPYKWPCSDSRQTHPAPSRTIALVARQRNTHIDCRPCSVHWQRMETHRHLNRESLELLWCRTKAPLSSFECLHSNLTFVKISINFARTNSSAIFASPKIWMLNAAKRITLCASCFCADFLIRLSFRFTLKHIFGDFNFQWIGYSFFLPQGQAHIYYLNVVVYVCGCVYAWKNRHWAMPTFDCQPYNDSACVPFSAIVEMRLEGVTNLNSHNWIKGVTHMANVWLILLLNSFVLLILFPSFVW